MFALRCMYLSFKRGHTKLYDVQIRNSSLCRRFIEKNLLFTNSITSGLCMFLGDLIQQEIENQQKQIPTVERYDWARLARMFTVGTALGPLHHYYYIYLDKFMPRVNLKTVFAKIVADQIIAGPVTILAFFYGMGVLERKTTKEIKEEITDKFLYAFMVDCIYWPPVQFFNFYYLPTHYRVLYINVATMIYNIFLSFLKHYDQEK